LLQGVVVNHFNHRIAQGPRDRESSLLLNRPYSAPGFVAIMTAARDHRHFSMYRDTIKLVDKRTEFPRMERSLTAADYQSLAELRYQIRKFLYFSEQAARRAGLEPRQHQLLLGLKGLPADVRPSIGELAERLQIQHHSAVELTNRLAKGGYVRRFGNGQDRREVLLSVTGKGEKILRQLSLDHRAELREQGPALIAALRRIVQNRKNRKSSVSAKS
jgi:DNA-binding MarR family transcriptional regulator